QLGVVLILFSTLTLALHHVVVQVMGTPGKLFGSEALALGGVLSLKTFSSSLLLFWVRMIAIVPLMAWVSGVLYPPVWRDVRALFALRDRRWLWSLVGSGIFLLLSQVFLYIAISETTPAIAVALSSTYPIAMLPLTWLLFGDRPPRLRVVGLLILLVGLGFTVFAAPIALSNEGLVAALLSGVMLALYLVSMMIINRRKVNPVPISLIQNATMFVLSSLFLIGVGTKAAPSDWTGLLVGGLILGSLTIVSYALNDFGSRLLGAARATIIAASVPVLTALLAFIILPAANSLSLGQIVGIFVVTLGTVALSLERILSQYKAMRRSKVNSVPQ
ncbi:MAG TPA: DMT family transporter, partial [Allocoleopsis sp.]